MSTSTFLTGQLLIAQPKSQDRYFSRTIVLIAQHTDAGAWGVVINKPAKTVDMKDIMTAAGIEYSETETVYVGGPVEPTRIHVVHTLDWSSPSTLAITDEIGITGDVSVLSAISAGTGPRLYRAGVGLAVWSAGQLEGEQSGKTPWTDAHQWLTTPATVDLCLTGSGREQWQRAIDANVNQTISMLF